MLTDVVGSNSNAGTWNGRFGPPLLRLDLGWLVDSDRPNAELVAGGRDEAVAGLVVECVAR